MSGNAAGQQAQDPQDPQLPELLGDDDDDDMVDVAVTYTFVVSVQKPYTTADVGEAVRGYIGSVGFALDNPVSVEEV